MIETLFGLENLAICVLVGFGLIALWCVYFFAMMAYAIVAECNGLPMPLDENYLIGKINTKLWLGMAIVALALIII